MPEEVPEVQAAPEYKPGELAPTIVTTKQVWKPEDLTKAGVLGTIQELVKGCANTDEAARRFSVLATWEARHMDRGYQYLVDDGGGWKIAGTDGRSKNKNHLAAADDANLYPTNIFSAQGDIATGALNRGKIKVSFSPRRSKNPQDVAASDEANNYKYLWEKNNNNLQREVMDLGWTDPRVLVWTRTIADKRFGLDDDGNPRTKEISSAFGVLESKLPMMADKLSACGSAQLFEEIDYADARATYTWMGNKIKPSWGTAGELEFERIARINTRIGLVGKYITGTSGLRETTMCYTWFRPGRYWDDQVQAVQREFFLKNFPDGMFVVMAGPDICCVWEESLDEHLAHGMFTRGFGQNRRSLGSSDIPIQKRVNIWADLWDKFIRTAIPMTLLDDRAFNSEAIAQLEANPARFVPVALEETQTMESVVGQTPAPQPIPGMSEMFQWYVGPLIQSIDGATPALFGGGEGVDNTVGATQIRLQQALERYGPTWIMANLLFAEACTQAAKSCAENGSSVVEDSVEGVGDVSVDPSKLKGNFYCTADTITGIPESGAQREAKVLEILEMAQSNPQVASIVGTPSNAREIVKALHIDDVITVDEANWEDGALEDIETLLESEPLINPDWQKLTDQVQELTVLHDAAVQAAQADMDGGMAPDEDSIGQGEQMAQQLEQLQEQLQQTPQYLPSVPVAQDASEDHATIAATVLAWMGEPDGRALRRAAQKDKEGGKSWSKWTNVYLFWQGHEQMKQKLTPPQPIPVKASAAIKIAPTPEQQTQLLQGMGMPVQQDPQSDLQVHEITEEREGIGPDGVPVKQKTSVVGKGLNS